MADLTTERLRDYLGPVTNTDVWSWFKMRPDDVVVTTPPKCGTTWMLNIVMMLIHGKVVPDAGGWHSAPWVDCNFRDRHEITAFLDGLTRRRCLKSHTPMDGVPYASEPTYIVVYRHPVDMHFSMRSFAENLKINAFDHIFAGDDRAGFKRFLEGPSTEQGMDDMTLASLGLHYAEARAREPNGNVHFFHYTDLTRDPASQIRRVARLLELQLSPELCAEIVEATSFRAMRKAVEASEMRFHKDASMHDLADFYVSGSSNKWVGRLPDSDMSDYDARMAELFAPDDIAWLNWGDRRAP